MADFQNLQIWQKSMQLTVAVYKLVRLLPKEENYGLSDQMRRASVSIPSNIAEGYSRNSDREFLHFLNIANGSRAELQTQLLLCVQLEYLTEKQISAVKEQCEEIGRMITALRKKL